MRVIRTLGMELAQTRVDLAFTQARLEMVREVVGAAMTSGLSDDFLLSLQGILS